MSVAADGHGSGSFAQPFAKRAVLVTGGAGFIGSHLVELLADAGAVVTVLDNLFSGAAANLAGCRDRLELVHADVLDEAFPKLVASRSFDTIFHLAANSYVPPSVERPWDDFQRNLVATMRLLEVLRESAAPTKLILTSSAAVYGDLDASPIHEGHPTVPISPYGVSKLAVERYGAVYAGLYGLRVASLRLFSVYGPRQRKQVVYDVLRKINESDGDVRMFGDGTQVRDFNYVTDTASAALAVAATSPLRGEVYNVAGGSPWSIRELVDMLIHLTGRRVKVHWSGQVRPGDPQRWLADGSRLAMLG